MSQYKCKHFGLRELVPRDVFEARGVDAWELLGPNALRALDNIREEFGPTWCNDWWNGGRFQQRGLRTDPGVGATYSQHRYGRGFDIHFSNFTVREVREKLLEYIRRGDPRFSMIKGIGIHEGFLHFDTRNRDQLVTFTYGG